MVNGSRWLDGVTFNMGASPSAHSDHPLVVKSRLLHIISAFREDEINEDAQMTVSKQCYRTTFRPVNHKPGTEKQASPTNGLCWKSCAWCYCTLYLIFQDIP
jgi:hypothetical protein